MANCLPSICILWYYNADDATIADPLPIVCTNSSYESGGRSVGTTATYYFDLLNQQNYMYKICFIACYYLPTCFHCLCDHLQGSFTRYKEYNNLPYGTSGIIQCYNICHTLSSSTYTLLQFTVFLVPLEFYPDDDHSIDRNMPVINNM